MTPRPRAFWQHRSLAAHLLWPISLLYGLLCASRNWLYRKGWRPIVRLPVPVIVVGNVLVGGSGKTPLVMALVQHLQERGWRPGVISRGYGRAEGGCLEVMPEHEALRCGDEPLLIRRRTGLPVFVAADRVQAARALLQAHPQVNVLLADDGLQHHRLGRQANIVVFDERGLGNGWLLPAGPLREKWPRRAGGPVQALDLIVCSAPSREVKGWLCPRALARQARDARGEPVALESLRGSRLQALAGIAKPEAFFGMLEQSGLRLERTHAFADHHIFKAGDVPDEEGLTLLMTEKDAVKLMPAAAGLKTRLLAVPLQIELDPALLKTIDDLLASHRDAAHPIPSGHGQTIA